MDCPKYPLDPVRSVESLCYALNISETALRSIAKRAPKLYIGPMPKEKSKGGIRDVYDTKPPLKMLLKRINLVFFKRVYFPPFLTGSLAGRDFVANVNIHKGARRAITEDIKSFFDNITADHVRGIWTDFFRFSDEVADILTALTTRNGRVFQGTPTSSYLANLVFWNSEPNLVNRLTEKGFRYSRYVDDVAVSSAGLMSEEEKQWVIAQIYALFRKTGFNPNRKKHEGMTSKNPIRFMGLNANGQMKATLPKEERARIRAQVYQLEKTMEQSPAFSGELTSDLNKASGKVGKLQRLHPTEATKLRQRINLVRQKINNTASV
jgi:Reverse transcriptase (RNA-dependent DNA polymerase)